MTFAPFFRRSQCLGSLGFRFNSFANSSDPPCACASTKQYRCLAGFCTTNFRFRFVFGLFNSRCFFCLFVCSKGRREREVSGVFILCEHPAVEEKSNDARKVFKKTRSRRTKTYLVSPRSRSRSPLAPPVKAFESVLFLRIHFLFPKIYFYTLSLSLCLSLSVLFYQKYLCIAKGQLANRQNHFILSLFFPCSSTRVVVVVVAMMKGRMHPFVFGPMKKRKTTCS